MFEIDSEYINEVNANYWAEVEAMKAGIHPLQIKDRVMHVLIDSGNNGKITFMDYNSLNGPRVGVSVDGNFYGVFNYIKNEFESTSESKLIEYLEVTEMGINSK